MKWLLLLLLIPQAFAQTLPLDWVNEYAQQNKGQRQQGLDSSGEYVDHIFGLQQETLNQHENQNSGLSLSRFATAFSVSKSGLMGFSSLKATHAVEIHWEKNKRSS
jgi:hypothetical protein